MNQSALEPVVASATVTNPFNPDDSDDVSGLEALFQSERLARIEAEVDLNYAVKFPPHFGMSFPIPEQGS